MPHLLDVAELLIASWILGGNEEDDRIPTSHGILDRALELAVERGAFPPEVRDELHFVDSRVGLRCVELPEILVWAQRALLTTVPNPTYQSTQIQISPKAARRILSDLDITDVTEESAVEWGRLLRGAVDEIREEMHAYPEPAIEEY